MRQWLVVPVLAITLVASALSAEPGLREAIRHEIALLPFLSVFDDIEFEVNGGEVVLFGQVSRPGLKTDAEAALRRVEGVQRIVNHIEVLPQSANDDRLRLALHRALAGCAAAGQDAIYPEPRIRILVDHGAVTLVGGVATEFEKETAGLLAREVDGALTVRNNLRVCGESIE